MTEHKFTDEEIIKGLKCLMGEHIVCKECAYSKINGGFSCKKKSATNALDLINRQKAEIRAYDIALKFDAEHYREEIVQLKAEVAYWMDAAANAKKEAVKEFAERLKKECLFDRGYEILQDGTIDHLVKEFTEEKT